MNMLNFYDRFWGPSLEVLASVENNGILLDRDQLNNQAEQTLQEATEHYSRLSGWVADYLRQIEQPEINWASPAQLGNFLYNYKCLPIPKVMGTLSAVKLNRERKPSTSEASLDWLAKEISDPGRSNLRTLLKARKLVKLSEFMVSLPQKVSLDRRLRCNFSPSTDTGRLSSSKPNLQNIPSRSERGRQIRKAFIAQPGYSFVVADYSQLEMYVLAHFLVYLFGNYELANDLKAGDVHISTAARCWPSEFPSGPASKEELSPKQAILRGYAKTINYAVNYGKTAVGLGQQIQDENGEPVGRGKAQELLDIYFSAYPGIVAFHEWCFDYARKNKSVPTLLGRARPLADVNSKEKWVVASELRKAINTPIQGSAADIVTTSLLRLSEHCTPCLQENGWGSEELRQLGSKLVLQVHDELVFEVPKEKAAEAAKIIKYEMENPFKKRPLAVPLKADVVVVDNWGEAK